MSNDFLDMVKRASIGLTADATGPDPARWKDGTKRDSLPLDASGHELDLLRAGSEFSYYSLNRDLVIAARRAEKLAALKEEAGTDLQAQNERARAKAKRLAERNASDEAGRAEADAIAHRTKWGLDA